MENINKKTIQISIIFGMCLLLLSGCSGFDPKRFHIKVNPVLVEQKQQTDDEMFNRIKYYTELLDGGVLTVSYDIDILK